MSVSKPVPLPPERPYKIRKHVAPLIEVDCSKWGDTSSERKNARNASPDQPAADRPISPADDSMGKSDAK
jgi:hypothetical protein